VAIGKILGSDLLGVYWIAFQYGTQPTLLITTVMIAVIFPTYANISGDINALREKHRRVLRYLALASFPIGVGLASVSPSFIISLFGSQWSGAVAPLSLLCIFGIMFSVTSTSGSVFMSTNNARQMFKQNIVMIIPFVVLLLPAVKYFGLTGVALLFVGVIFVQLLWTTKSVSRILSYAPLEDLRLIYAIPVAASTAMGLVVVAVWLILGTSIITLAVQIPVGFAVYGAVVIAATKGEIIQEMRSILGTILHRGKA
jgi:O-antigen/teichoic acid export membrane protein